MAQMRVCFIGDSFVSGTYDDECLGWVGRIAAAARKRNHDLSAYNLGIRGETSVQTARRWRAEAEVRQSPQQEGRLGFEFGVNDAREEAGERPGGTAPNFAGGRGSRGPPGRGETARKSRPPPRGGWGRQ